MFRTLIKTTKFPSHCRNLTTSSSLKIDGKKVNENAQAQENRFFKEEEAKQLRAINAKLKKKAEYQERCLEDEIGEIEAKMAGLKKDLSKKKIQLAELKSEE